MFHVVTGAGRGNYYSGKARVYGTRLPRQHPHPHRDDCGIILKRMDHFFRIAPSHHHHDATIAPICHLLRPTLNIKAHEYSHSTSICFDIFSCMYYYTPRHTTRRFEYVFQVFRGVGFLCSAWRFDPLRWNLVFWASLNLFFRTCYSRIQMEYRPDDSGCFHTRRFLHSREEKL